MATRHTPSRISKQQSHDSTYCRIIGSHGIKIYKFEIPSTASSHVGDLWPIVRVVYQARVKKNNNNFDYLNQNTELHEERPCYTWNPFNITEQCLCAFNEENMSNKSTASVKVKQLKTIIENNPCGFLPQNICINDKNVIKPHTEWALKLELVPSSDWWNDR